MQTPRELSEGTRSYAQHRNSPLLNAVLGCLVLGNAVLHSPSLLFDVAVLLTGTAFVMPVSWRGSWSFRFLIRSAVGVYFFRCVLLYLLGTDAIQTVAFVDAMMGIAAIGIASFAPRCIIRYRTFANDVGSPPGCRAQRGGNEVMEQEVDGSTPTSREEEAVWTPVHFNVKTMLLLSVPFAGLVVMAIMGGIGLVFAVVILGLVWVCFGRCVQLVSMGAKTSSGIAD